MVLGKIKSRQEERGFTIVELLIVVVVIGILAAITIVAYSGITNRANTTKAQTNAANVQKVAEAMNADNGSYPRLTTDFTTGSTSTKLPGGIVLFIAGNTTTNATPDASNGLTNVWYQYCGTVAAPAAGAATGGRIQYWDFTTNALSTNVVYVGTGAAGLGVGAGTVCNTWVTPAS